MDEGLSTFSVGEGARRADEGHAIPSSVSLRSPALPSARKQSQEKLLFCLTEGLRSRRGEASFMTFPWGKVPAGRMGVSYYRVQRRRCPQGG